jgi:plasmid replication initiation protein
MTTFIVDEVKGKYSQRLLDLLMQYKGSGLFVMNYDKFKELLEIPESYRACDIDNQILKKSISEFKKIGLLITDIEKVKEGRSIKNIKIKFKFEEKKKKANNSSSQSLEKTDFTVLSGKIVIKMKSAYKNTWMNHMEELNECKTIEELEKFIETYKLFDKKGELLNINSEI